MERVVCELTMLEIKTDTRTKYKVTRRIPLLGVAETLMFDSKEDAMQQLATWSNA
jgi:hypothetical protein